MCCRPYPQLWLSEYWPFIVTWRRVWDPARRERNFYSILMMAGRSSKSSLNSKLPVWSTWTSLHPYTHLNGWLHYSYSIYSTSYNARYDASRILWLQNQQNRMNRFDCSIWLLACQITNDYQNEDSNHAWKRLILLFWKIIAHTFLETRKSMVTYPICTLAIHPFIWGGADVAVLLPMDSCYTSPWCDISCPTHI